MGRTKRKSLGERHQKILVMVERFQKQNGYPPSIREICDKTSISSTSVVNYYLEQLEDWGYIERDGRVSRGIRLLQPALNSDGTNIVEQVKQKAGEVVQSVEEILHIPVAGRIFASIPVPVPTSDFPYFDAESMVDIARSMLPAREKGNDLFALEVQGDSMIDAMVNEGDYVIMKPAQRAKNGEMVAVWLKDRDETTLKYFYQEDTGRVRLQPENPTMKPIFVDDPNNIEIQGKVVMVVRQVDSMPI